MYFCHCGKRKKGFKICIFSAFNKFSTWKDRIECNRSNLATNHAKHFFSFAISWQENVQEYFYDSQHTLQIENNMWLDWKCEKLPTCVFLRQQGLSGKRLFSIFPGDNNFWPQCYLRQWGLSGVWVGDKNFHIIIGLPFEPWENKSI